MRTMRGALLALAIGIIVGVGATLQFGMPGRSGSAVDKPAAKAPLASASSAPLMVRTVTSPPGIAAVID